MSWLDQLLALKVQSSGTDVGTRQTLNFIGATVADDSVNNRVNVTISAGGITALTGDVTASGSGSVAATVAKVNGVAITGGAPAAGETLIANAADDASWGALPVSSLTSTGGATGDLLVGSGTALQRLGIGSTGQVLTVSGGTAAWGSISTGQKLSIATKTDTTSTAWTTVGAFTQNWPSPAAYTSWIFSAIASAPSGYTVEVRLYNQTAAAVVTSSTVSTSATIPTALTSSALTIPTDGSTPIYLIQFRIASGSPGVTDIATVYGAYSTLS